MPARRDFELKILNDKPEVVGPALYIVSHSTWLSYTKWHEMKK